MFNKQQTDPLAELITDIRRIKEAIGKKVFLIDSESTFCGWLYIRMFNLCYYCVSKDGEQKEFTLRDVDKIRKTGTKKKVRFWPAGTARTAMNGQCFSRPFLPNRPNQIFRPTQIGLKSSQLLCRASAIIG